MTDKPADPRRLYLQIAEKLRDLIAQPEFAPNGRLPSERALAATLAVSRPSVREALVALELEGLVEIRMGSGVYVCPTPPTHGKEPLSRAELGDSLLDIMGARCVIEGSIAASVAPFCKAKDLKHLRELYEEMQREVSAGRIPVAADRAFHLAIAQMTGNEVLVRTVSSLFDARHSPLSEKLRGHFENESTWGAVPDEHRVILEALEAHDPIQAQASMQRHLKMSLERVIAGGRPNAQRR
ncbi:FadR/GntR family transcriptional regulator [Paraburkholderia phenoliruptrix]|uniref:L-lactate dehydrogenase operon regulatory protein n=2 Tax=Paraburkholderia phenoliruptrix TaxID=252970 RepID=A0A6J5K9U4_9BURK|nr:FadR/GntR family transcriptional regulator [Paraburkholderia phenoliruptrix]AFT84679.1 GntR family transcriptional regulator [Paraburkholderia phenoliruptrix BR3459a]MDR6420343.1 GntR family transcriptional repressor for pyruvate dehydrogenase complex [Paraburkholderia phenoliruptrix]WMY07602.1 FadR/GntR family transcriptional regulator [Paraburkholderia phenoliruptrix]CAB3706885.1 Putative L-lactate dehydrogenase operon regulatory protein [Paraburkholderia phenoliruptrix]CAB4049644.1 Putat